MLISATYSVSGKKVLLPMQLEAKVKVNNSSEFF